MTGTYRRGSAGLAHRAPGIFVIPWTGLRPEDSDDMTPIAPDSLEPGQALRLTAWPGRLDARGSQLVLEGGKGVAELHARAARIAKLLSRQSDADTPILPEPDDTVLRGSLVLTDGRTSYACAVIDGPPRLLAFHGRHPAPGVQLWVARIDKLRPPRKPAAPAVMGVLAQTPIATPDGLRPAEGLRAGDLVLTQDAGAVALAWTGSIALSGARLRVAPDLRPLRVPAAALGIDRPAVDLRLAPEHRVVVSGPAARALFNTDEVLTTAASLRDVAGVTPDYGAGAVCYHLLACARPHILQAAGAPVESFDPARLDTDTLEASSRTSLLAAFPELARDPGALAPPARRVLTLSEAAILGHRLH